MTRQEYQSMIQLIKRAKGTYHARYGLTPDAFERMQKVIMARIDQSSANSPVSRPAYPRWGTISGLARYFIPPQFAYVIGVFVLLAATGAMAAISLSAMPGDSLYSAKIALEKTQVRFTSNPASRAKVQMELAGRRLAEAEAAPSSPQAAQDALKRFSQDIRVAKETLKQAADPAQRESAAEVITQKARQYEEKLVEVKMNPRRTVNVAASEAIEDAEKALEEVKGLELENRLQEEPVKAEASSGADGEAELKNGEVGI